MEKRSLSTPADEANHDSAGTVNLQPLVVGDFLGTHRSSIDKYLLDLQETDRYG